MTDTVVQTTKNLALIFIERAGMLGFKGKKRDDLAIEFFVGAGCAARAVGHTELYDHLTRVLVMVIAVRGYFGVKELAADE